MPTRQNFSGPVPNTVLLLLLAVDRHNGSQTRPSQPAIKCASSVSSDLSIDKHVSNKFIVFLLASSDSKNSLFAWHWICKNIGTRFRLIPRWWLQHRAGRVIKGHHWQRLLNAAARVVGRTHKFDRGLTHLPTASSIGWMFLSVYSSGSEWLFVGVCRAMLLSSLWTSAACKATTDVASRQWLRSASWHQLIVPLHRRTKFGR